MGLLHERIGAAIRQLRERRGLSQSAVARMRDKDDQSRMSKVERGVQQPSLDLLDSYLVALEAHPYELVDALLEKEPTAEEIAEQALGAYRLGALSEAEREFVLEQILSHRQFLLNTLHRE
jgi:transcriptional regulator with XRE-family HTH domain